MVGKVDCAGNNPPMTNKLLARMVCIRLGIQVLARLDLLTAAWHSSLGTMRAGPRPNVAVMSAIETVEPG